MFTLYVVCLMIVCFSQRGLYLMKPLPIAAHFICHFVYLRAIKGKGYQGILK